MNHLMWFYSLPLSKVLTTWVLQIQNNIDRYKNGNIFSNIKNGKIKRKKITSNWSRREGQEVYMSIKRSGLKRPKYIVSRDCHTLTRWIKMLYPWDAQFPSLSAHSPLGQYPAIHKDQLLYGNYIVFRWSLFPFVARILIIFASI